MDSKLTKLFEILNQDPKIRDNMLVCANSIESTKRLNIRAFLRKAYREPLIRQAFDDNVDGLVISFKLNKDALRKKLDIEDFDLLEDVINAVKSVYGDSYDMFVPFVAKLGTTKYFNVVVYLDEEENE